VLALRVGVADVAVDAEEAVLLHGRAGHQPADLLRHRVSGTRITNM
jgi:hypothetical protein